jgi:glucosamine--fructose-6-phosphate aminotransferase (isomerizing)
VTDEPAGDTATHLAPDTGTAPPGGLMAAEIAEQPAVLAALLARAPELGEVAAALARREPRFVLVTARGTSDHAALYAKYLVEIRQGRPAGLVSPSTMTVYGSRPDLSGVLFVAVSQSGGSPDLAESTAVARSCGATTVAVTNSAGSALATAAEFAIDLGAGPERAVAATKTYTAELLALYLLLGGSAEAAHGLPAAADRTLAGAPAAYAAAARYRFANRLVTTGRGYSYPAACEGALKLMETSYLSAHAFSTADLLHGPVAMLDSAVPVIAVVSPGRGGDAARPVVAQLRETGADVLVVGTGDLPVAAEGLPEELLPVLEILPLQQLAWRLAIDRGGDPDRPRGLSKVTRTR